MPVILAARNIDRDVIEPIAVAMQHEADRHVPAMRAYIHQSMRNAIGAIDDRLLRRGIEMHDLRSIVDAIPELAPSWWPHVKLMKAQNTTGNTLADRLAEQYGDSARLAVSLAPAFDVVNPRAVEWARERAGKLLSDLDGQALVNARNAVAYGIEHGRTVEQTAQFLKSTLYLPPRGQQAVTNYFDALIARVEKGDDLAEAARAAAQGRALAPKQFLDAQNIDTLTDRYADRWAKYVAEAQARTLTIEASNEGLRGGWQEAADSGLFNPSTATVVWYATKDDLVCPECAALDGTEVGFSDGTFTTTIGEVQTPPAHVNCRCTLVLITKSFNPNAQPPRFNPHTPPVPVEASSAAGEVPTAQEHAAFVDALRSKYGLPDVDIAIRDSINGDRLPLPLSNDTVHYSIEHIGGTKGSRDALNIIKDVISEADRRGFAVTITPSDTTSPSRTILRQLGFKSASKGEIKTADTLVREAGSIAKEPVPRIPRVPEPTPPVVVPTLPPLEGDERALFNALEPGKEYRILDLVQAHPDPNMTVGDIESTVKKLIDSGHIQLRTDPDTFARFFTRAPGDLAPSAPTAPVVDHPAFVGSLRTKYGLDNISIGEHDTYLSIDHIGAAKGDGLSRKVIEDVMKEGERRGLPVTITPSDATSPSPTVLRNLGFKSARGEFGSDSLVWRPGGAAVEPRPAIPRIPRAAPTPAPPPTVEKLQPVRLSDREFFDTLKPGKVYSFEDLDSDPNTQGTTLRMLNRLVDSGHVDRQIDAATQVRYYTRTTREIDTVQHMTRADIVWGSQKTSRELGPMFDEVDKIHSFSPYSAQWGSKYGTKTTDQWRLEIVSKSQTASEARAGTGGWFRSGSGQIKSMANKPVDEQMFTTLHEFGHAMDNVWAGSGSNAFGSEGIGFDPAVGQFARGLQSENIEKAWATWHDAVYGSDKFRDAPSLFNPKFLRYFRSEREAWARSYSQYMARRLGGGAENGLRYWQIRTQVQWTDQDFAAHRIGEAVEGVLRAMGLME